MQFIVFFYEDREIVILEEEDVFLGEYAKFTRSDWLKPGEYKVRALYNDNIYDACILQVGFDFQVLLWPI